MIKSALGYKNREQYKLSKLQNFVYAERKIKVGMSGRWGFEFAKTLLVPVKVIAKDLFDSCPIQLFAHKQ